jgi:hypothetical protein
MLAGICAGQISRGSTPIFKCTGPQHSGASVITCLLSVLRAVTSEVQRYYIVLPDHLVAFGNPPATHITLVPPLLYPTTTSTTTETHLSYHIAIMLQTVDPSQTAPVPSYTTPLTPPISNDASPSISSASLNDTSSQTMAITNHHHILIVTGPAGCGKSTVAKYLSERYGFDYIEGDEVSNSLAPKSASILILLVPPQSEH